MLDDYRVFIFNRRGNTLIFLKTSPVFDPCLCVCVGVRVLVISLGRCVTDAIHWSVAQRRFRLLSVVNKNQSSFFVGRWKERAAGISERIKV